jgi:hypothetical protein
MWTWTGSEETIESTAVRLRVLAEQKMLESFGITGVTVQLRMQIKDSIALIDRMKNRFTHTL